VRTLEVGTYITHIDMVRLCLSSGATNGHIIHPQVIYEYEQPWLNDIDRIKSKISEKTLFQCLTVHHKCTWTEPGTNLRLRAEMHATNHLSHGTAS
jgi:hypothetical protein